ncbi:arylsulfate sulfotransferase-like protein [Shewanella psychrophila]|uniref:Arylsulfate sulfotransferase-like protein n=2 Tax=Shewanella TaxID=22 RepID=A0A1S6HR33_9GAMM|nr:arylsulfate sulfotransferase-like protein [Shewanella psychrophila]
MRIKAMDNLFFDNPTSHYLPIQKSIRIQGHVTSISLEKLFWDLLDQIAESQGVKRNQFIASLYIEALNHHGDVKNFTSLLRSACVQHILSRENV